MRANARRGASETRTRASETRRATRRRAMATMVMTALAVPGSARAATRRCAFARAGSANATATRVADACATTRSCGACLAASVWEAHGEGASDASGAEARACALAAIGAVEDATIRASALARAMGCAPTFFRDGARGELDEALREWSRERCEDEGRAFRSETPMDGDRERGARRIRARAAATAAACCGACEDDGRCDGWSWCDDRAPGGCGKDYLVFPFEPGECLHFRLVDDDGRRAFVDETRGFEREDGAWVSSLVSRARAPEKKRPSEVKLNERRRTRTAYVRRRVESKRAARERE